MRGTDHNTWKTVQLLIFFKKNIPGNLRAARAPHVLTSSLPAFMWSGMVPIIYRKPYNLGIRVLVPRYPTTKFLSTRPRVLNLIRSSRILVRGPLHNISYSITIRFAKWRNSSTYLVFFTFIDQYTSINSWSNIKNSTARREELDSPEPWRESRVIICSSNISECAIGFSTYSTIHARNVVKSSNQATLIIRM